MQPGRDQGLGTGTFRVTAVRTRTGLHPRRSQTSRPPPHDAGLRLEALFPPPTIPAS